MPSVNLTVRRCRISVLIISAHLPLALRTVPWHSMHQTTCFGGKVFPRGCFSWRLTLPYFCLSNFQNSRWRTAAILKIVISPYLSEKSSDFDEILYTAADFELDERHVIRCSKMKKLHWTDFEFGRTIFLSPIKPVFDAHIVVRFLTLELVGSTLYSSR